MYLTHDTTIKYLKLILKDGYLKSNKLTKKLNHGANAYYDNNPFVYFSTTTDLFDDKILGNITLYFNSKLLYNRNFYVSNFWTSKPDKLEEIKIKNNIISYRRKYNKYYQYYDDVLLELYKKSIRKDGSIDRFIQQVAINNKVNLFDLVGIYFKVIPDDKSIIKYINKNYPFVKIYIKYTSK